MANLKGRRVALLEARMSEEAATLVRRLGGIPYQVPAVRDIVHPEQVGPFIDTLSSGGVTAAIFLTGVGVTALLREAGRLDRLDEALAALRRTTIVCRGPKPVAVLKQNRVPVHVLAAEPYTTKELLDALAAIDVNAKAVALVHYGEPNEALSAALSARGARLEQLFLYEWMLPADVGPLKQMVRDMIDGAVDAVAFTNQIQARHLFRVAGDLGLSDPLARALNGDVIVAAIGPVCAEALQALGVTPDLIPARPRMAPLITALAEYFDLTEGLP